MKSDTSIMRYSDFIAFCSVKRFAAAVCFFFIGVFGLVGTLAANEAAISQVEKFHDVLLSTMKEAKSLGVSGRYQKLEVILPEVFHLKAMIQISSGSFWQKSSELDRDQLTDAFTRLTIATYASQFDGYSGQVFTTSGVKPGPQKTTLVETVLTTPGSSGVALTYVMREVKGQWRVIDVLLDTGISELARKRSEYRQILKISGTAGLIKILKAKTNSLLANN